MQLNVTTFLPALALAAAAAAACSSGPDDAVPVATPSVTLSSPAAAIGSPIEMRYRFAVALDAPPFAEDYWVFVHFLDTDGELMWTDDHQPATPTRQWKAGASVEYARTIFIPKFPYVGQTRVEVGLFSPGSGERLPMMGETEGQRAYRVATFDMRLQSDNLFVVFRDGWHETEVGPEGTGLEWQWSRRDATLAFPNPKRDVEVYLQVDQPVAGLPDPQRVQISVGPLTVDSFQLAPGGRDLRRIRLAAGQLGTGETVELTISVDETFVPAAVPALKSGDPRELGIRVFRAYVKPL
jgi:hypothetical protein